MKQEIINRIENIISNESANEKEVLYQLKNLLYEIEFKNSSARDSKNIAELYSNNMQVLQNNQLTNVIKTGFKNFDDEFGGFLPGEFVVIGGRPSMGKTQLLVNLSLNISQKTSILYFTFDLSEFLLTNRFISSLSGVPVSKILLKTLSNEENRKLTSLEQSIQKQLIFINDSCNNSISAFTAHCKKQVEENDVKIIIVDYLQMMSSSKHRNNREMEISYISKELKNIAKENNVCVIATSQLSRAVETRGGYKKPHLSDLRESGAIEQDADKVIFIYRYEYYGITEDEEGNNTAGLMELIMAKNRNGNLGSIKLMRDKNFTTFSVFENKIKDFEFDADRLNELEKPF